jgi:AcrR family transcriptional regulator
MVGLASGLRERKKQRTRREISDVATMLFARRGFEQVTLAEIAEAAEVSVKTIFNYFGSKEELYFDRRGELRDSLIATVRERDPGTTVLEAIHALLRDNAVPFRGRGWAGFDDPEATEAFREFFAVQDRSPALQARRLTIAEELGDEVRGVLAEELGRDARDLAVVSLTAMLIAAMHLRDRTLRAALADGVSHRTLRRRVVATVDEAFARLQAAYADVDRPRA